MAFAAFVANSARYEAVYSSFPIVIVFLIWLYTGWLIFLIGAEVTYFHQYPSAFLYEAMTDGKVIASKSGWLSQHWLRLRVAISRIDLLGSKRSLPPVWGFRVLGNLIDEFVRSSILLKSAEPEGVAFARGRPKTFL